MSPPLTVSVVVPCYNYGAYLPACLDSVLAQTRPAFEIVVVDDGSTDDTAAVVAPYLGDGRVHFHQQANSGQATAKNLGIRHSRGDIVAFLDADDLWMPEKLARQVPLFDDPAVGVTFTGQRSIDAEGRPLATFGRRGYLTFRRGRITPWLGFENIVPFSSSAVRRALLVENRGFDTTLGMGIDWDLWLRLSLVTDFDFVPDPLFAYRVHGHQMSRNLSGRIDASEHIFRTFVSRHPGAFSTQELQAVEFYNACSRGRALRGVDRSRSDAYFRMALRMKPWSPRPYLGLLKNAVAGRR